MALLADYSVENLSKSDMKQVEIHLAVCSDCRAELSRIEKIMSAVESLQPIEPPVGLWNGVYNRINDESQVQVSPKQSWLDFLRAKRAVTAVAATVIAGALFFSLNINRTEYIEKTPDAASMGYIQRHVSMAAFDPLADKINAGIVASTSTTDGDAMR